MARAFDDASSQYLSYAGAIVSSVPLSFSAWFYADDVTAEDQIVTISNSGGIDRKEYWGLVLRGDQASDPLFAETGDGANYSFATSSTGVSVNTWHHGCAVFSAANARAIYLDGGSKGTNASSRTPSGIDTTSIAARYNLGAGDYFSGNIAEVVIRNVALNDRDVWEHAQGKPPWEIKPESIVGLWLPFGDRTDRDFSGRGYHMTAYNAPTWTADPPQVVKAWRSNPQYIGRRIVGRESPLAVAARPIGLSPAAPAVTSILTTYAGYAQPIGA